LPSLSLAQAHLDMLIGLLVFLALFRQGPWARAAIEVLSISSRGLTVQSFEQLVCVLLVLQVKNMLLYLSLFLTQIERGHRQSRCVL
jgi:hypothetical protein